MRRSSRIGRHGAGGAPEQGCDPSYQLLGAERFAGIIAGARLQSRNPVRPGGPSCNDQAGCAAEPPPASWVGWRPPFTHRGDGQAPAMRSAEWRRPSGIIPPRGDRGHLGGSAGAPQTTVSQSSRIVSRSSYAALRQRIAALKPARRPGAICERRATVPSVSPLSCRRPSHGLNGAGLNARQGDRASPTQGDAHDPSILRR